MDPDDEGADLNCKLYDVFGCFEHANTFPPYYRLYLTSTLFEVCWGGAQGFSFIGNQCCISVGQHKELDQVTAKVTQQAEH